MGSSLSKLGFSGGVLRKVMIPTITGIAMNNVPVQSKMMLVIHSALGSSGKGPSTATSTLIHTLINPGIPQSKMAATVMAIARFLFSTIILCD